jgi:CO dehydrogenase maturation factor
MPAGPASVTAVVGKGGVGKTVVTALLASELIARRAGRLLLVDADPATGLRDAVGAGDSATVGHIRARIIAEARSGVADRAVSWAEVLDYRLLEALHEAPGFSLLAMGRTDTAGCFCPVNTLVRDALEQLSAGFDHVVVDAEAGIEQVNRRVVRRVTRALVVTDGSARGVRTAALLRDLLAADGVPAPASVGAVIDALGGDPAPARARLATFGLDVVAEIPFDPQVARHDADGRSLLELDDAGPARRAARRLADFVLGMATSGGARP